MNYSLRKKNPNYRPTPQDIANFRQGIRVGKVAYAYLSKQYGANVNAVAERPRYGNQKLRGRTRMKTKNNDRSNFVATSGNPAMRPAINSKFKQAKSQSKSNYLIDLISPPVQENYRELGFQLDTPSNTQDVKGSVHLTNEKIVQMIKKAKDCQNIQFKFALDPSTGSNLEQNGRLMFTGGWQKHTFMNSSAHTAYLTFYEYVCKMNCDTLPQAAWGFDLIRDGPLSNADVPSNIEQTVNTCKLEPNKRSTELNMKWKLVKKSKIHLAPGETHIYFMRRPKFYVDTGKWNIADNGVTKSFIKGITKSLMVTCYGEIVTTTADAAVTTGSTHVSHNMEEMNYFRCPLPQKQVMRYASGTFGSIASAANEITYNEETDAKASAYSEL